MIKGTYLFTDSTSKKVLEVRVIKGDTDEGDTPGEKALEYKSKLQKKLNTIVIAWSLMGGQNAEPLE